MVRSQPGGDPVRDFEAAYGFSFDDFQVRACEALADGSSVLVAAPTGAGKTVVGEFAAWMAIRGGGKTFYTTPIKALSNQKYGDFMGIYGPSEAGLLTGDNSLNSEASVVVMTTEVLRNMIYEDSQTLKGLHYVVLDEVHYLQDPYRGAVWEEILIHLPVDVQIVSLSATVSNAEEFGDWLQTLRGRTEVIIEEKRPVDIRHWYMASDELLPMFVQTGEKGPMPNPRGRDFDRRRRRGSERPQRGGRRVQEKRARVPFRTDVVDKLDSEDMLPAIYFIFSRRGCDDAVRQCLRDNVRLTTEDERKEIRQYADSRVAELSPNELDVLGYDRWMEGLVRGVAAHHAGMIPPFKETVEELFTRSLVKVVFATETLALGINMPARTVVLESLMKFTGEKHEMITPGQYTQFSGRAGRRGIDELGHSVVLMQRFIQFDAITRLASTRTYPLVSSFRPSYNMAVNLVRTYDQHEAEHLVNSSFAQFQADRDVVKLERNLESSEAYLASYRERTRCDLGEFDEYWELLQKQRKIDDRIGRTGRLRNQRVMEAIHRLRRGDVIELSAGKRRGRYVVIEVSSKGSEGRPKVLALSDSKSLSRFSANDFREPPRAIAHLRIPKGFHLADARSRREISQQLREVEADRAGGHSKADPGASKEEREIASALDEHPCADCPEIKRHVHFAERAERLETEVKGMNRRIRRRTGTLARRFEQVLDVLRGLGYVDGWNLTDKGELLTRVYNESDLLVVEALEQGLFEGLDAPEVAAVCSTLVYETRGPDAPEVSELPTFASDQVFRKLMKLWRQIRREEDARALELTREPDPGFAEKAYLWALGKPLEVVLDEDDAAGDFVRSTKQLIDLLRQLEEVAPDQELRDAVVKALEGLNRGVIAYSSLEF